MVVCVVESCVVSRDCFLGRQGTTIRGSSVLRWMPPSQKAGSPSKGICLVRKEPHSQQEDPGGGREWPRAHSSAAYFGKTSRGQGLSLKSTAIRRP